MRRPNGYGIARIDPFPKGRIGVGVIRPDPKMRGTMNYGVAVFMPPMKGVTIDVPLAGGRVEIDTKGMIPVLARTGQEWSSQKLLLMDEQKNLAPFTIANVYNTGGVCWGPSGIPRSMLRAWEEFWTRPFNTDLTDIPQDNQDDGGYEDWLENVDDVDYEPELARLKDRVLLHYNNAVCMASLGSYEPGRKSNVVPSSMLDAYHMQLHLYGGAPGANNYRGIWVDDMASRTRSLGANLERRRRLAAGESGRTWMGAAAHDTTWRSYLRFMEYLDNRVAGIHSGSDAYYEDSRALVGALFPILEPVKNIARNHGREFGNYLVDKYAGGFRNNPYHRYPRTTGYRDTAYREQLADVKSRLDTAFQAVSKMKPRWLRRIFHIWVRRWLTATFWKFAYESVEMRMESRLRVIYDNMDNNDDDDGDSPRARAIHAHFVKGEWTKTLEFNNPAYYLGAGLDKMEFPAPDKFDGVVLVPRTVVNIISRDKPWRKLMEFGLEGSDPYLAPVQRMPCTLWREAGQTRVYENSVYQRVFLGRRYRDTSLYLIEPIEQPGLLFLYDGRWQMARIDELPINEIARLAEDMERTEFWGNLCPAPPDDGIVSLSMGDITSSDVNDLVHASDMYGRDEGQDLI